MLRTVFLVPQATEVFELLPTAALSEKASEAHFPPQKYQNEGAPSACPVMFWS